MEQDRKIHYSYEEKKAMLSDILVPEYAQEFAEALDCLVFAQIKDLAAIIKTISKGKSH